MALERYCELMGVEGPQDLPAKRDRDIGKRVCLEEYKRRQGKMSLACLSPLMS